jgi:hypothetical protein
MILVGISSRILESIPLRIPSILSKIPPRILVSIPLRVPSILYYFFEDPLKTSFDDPLRTFFGDPLKTFFKDPLKAFSENLGGAPYCLPRELATLRLTLCFFLQQSSLRLKKLRST